jgi:hypothetical protein
MSFVAGVYRFSPRTPGQYSEIGYDRLLRPFSTSDQIKFSLHSKLIASTVDAESLSAAKERVILANGQQVLEVCPA